MSCSGPLKESSCIDIHSCVFAHNVYAFIQSQSAKILMFILCLLPAAVLSEDDVQVIL